MPVQVRVTIAAHVNIYRQPEDETRFMAELQYPQETLYDRLLTHHIDWDYINPNGIADDHDFWQVPADWEIMPLGSESEGTVWMDPEDQAGFTQLATVTTWRLKDVDYHPQLIINLIDEEPAGTIQYSRTQDVETSGPKACSVTTTTAFGFQQPLFGVDICYSKSKIDLFEDEPTGDVFLVQRTSVWVDDQVEISFGPWSAPDGIYSRY